MPSNACPDCIKFLEVVSIFREKILANQRMLDLEIKNNVNLSGTRKKLTIHKNPVPSATVQPNKSVKDQEEKEEVQIVEDCVDPLMGFEVPFDLGDKKVPVEIDSDSDSDVIVVMEDIPEKQAPELNSQSKETNAASTKSATPAPTATEPDLQLVGWSTEDEFQVVEYREEDSDFDLIEVIEEIDITEGPPELNSQSDAIPSASSASTVAEQAKSVPKPTSKAIKPIKIKPEKVNLSVVRLQGSRTEEESRLEAVMVEMGLFICKICELDCKTYYTLRTHVKAEHKPQPYDICCDKPLHTAPRLLYDHIRYHLDPDSFKCQKCGVRYGHSRALNSHIQDYHVADPNSFICDVCGKGFGTYNRVKDHKKSHTDLVECEHCGKSECSTNRDALKLVNNIFISFSEMTERCLPTHIKSQHEMEVNCICDLCGRGFPKMALLIGHISDHGGPHGGNRRKKKVQKRVIGTNIEMIQKDIDQTVGRGLKVPRL